MNNAQLEMEKRLRALEEKVFPKGKPTDTEETGVAVHQPGGEIAAHNKAQKAKAESASKKTSKKKAKAKK